jgi:hypothetical protein
MHSPSLGQFKSFPFLRDELFLQILAQFERIPIADSFGNFLFKAQCAYFQRYIDIDFDGAELLAASSMAPAQCPFSSAKPGGKSKFIVDESVLRSKMSLFHQSKISVSAIDSFANPNFQILTSGASCNAQDASLFMDQEFTVESENFRSAPLIIISENATFRFQSHEGELIRALAHFKQKFTAADIRCLLGKDSKFFIFSNEHMAEVLNLFIYAKITNFGLEDALKSVPHSKTPSRLEPYLDILTPEYVYENPDLFA